MRFACNVANGFCYNEVVAWAAWCAHLGFPPIRTHVVHVVCNVGGLFFSLPFHQIEAQWQTATLATSYVASLETRSDQLENTADVRHCPEHKK